MNSKISTKDILAKKAKGEKFAVITAYDAIFARLADAAGADMLLVGDSVGNTFLGFESTVGVTADMMLHHTAAAARANAKALLVADVPFAIAALSDDRLIEFCASLLRAGAQAVKIEGGKEAAGKIAKLTQAGVPVIGHIGLKPQQVLQLGGYRAFGKTQNEKEILLEDARALEEAGAFAMLLELVKEDAAAEITRALRIPTIGIGSGKFCDAQVLVCTDILGLSSYQPKFAKKYADCAKTVQDAFKGFVDEVKTGKFPE